MRNPRRVPLRERAIAGKVPLRTRLGRKRNVVVTPSTYGTDKRCTLEALGQSGGNARGVAVVDR
ncbi:hypothetical protein K788_0001722 (plasmid) [Paraburkholderia caribensis MBA4]|uniref:Uncharacterized protein n=1 Tax=Paraburkholderia caribensis MBA4 TaxID=1323664 RepID=A0A0N7JVR1_9BURK|nr:hypothetical protein K788_0001722 [Paraburkholderia caribensis MBA4]